MWSASNGGCPRCGCYFECSRTMMRSASYILPRHRCTEVTRLRRRECLNETSMRWHCLAFPDWKWLPWLLCQRANRQANKQSLCLHFDHQQKAGQWTGPGGTWKAFDSQTLSKTLFAFFEMEPKRKCKFTNIVVVVEWIQAFLVFVLLVKPDRIDTAVQEKTARRRRRTRWKGKPRTTGGKKVEA